VIFYLPVFIGVSTKSVLDNKKWNIMCLLQNFQSNKMRTRYCFNVVGTVRSKDFSSSTHFRVRSDTSINRVVEILCEKNNLDIHEVKTVTIITRTKQYSQHHRVPFDANKEITFRDEAVVGKKSIEVQVDMLVRW
jgi:hypothetical protein